MEGSSPRWDTLFRNALVFDGSGGRACRPPTRVRLSMPPVAG
jgi:hypothetical protein